MTVDRSGEWRASRQVQARLAPVTRALLSKQSPRGRRDEATSGILARSGVDLLRQRDAVGRRQLCGDDLRQPA